MLQPTTLRSFLAVAGHGSYTRAAHALDLSQPAVYRHIRELERLLGTRLVEQRGKRVVLTEHGRVVREFARTQADAEADLVQYLADDQSLTRGAVRIAGGTTSAEFILPTIAVGFRRRFPGIEIHVRAYGAPAGVDADVAGRRVDLGMHSAPRDAPGVTKTPFVGDVILGLTRRDHPLAQATEPVPPGRLAREPLVHFAPAALAGPGGETLATFQEQVNEWFGSAGIVPTVPLTVGTLEGMKRAVRDGGGVALMSRYAVDPGDPALATFELADPPRRDFLLVSRAAGWESAVVRAFREYALGLEWATGDPRGFTGAHAGGLAVGLSS